MIAFVLGVLFGFAAAHPAVRSWVVAKVTQLAAAIKAKVKK